MVFPGDSFRPDGEACSSVAVVGVARWSECANPATSSILGRLVLRSVALTKSGKGSFYFPSVSVVLV